MELMCDTYTYDAAGNMTFRSDILAANRTGSWTDAASNTFRFGGNELLTIRNAQLCDFVARIYDPATGRFITPDILREVYTRLNSYMYCGANPIAIIDPNGLGWITACYNGEDFYFFDSRIQSQEDIWDRYKSLCLGLHSRVA